MSDGNGIFDDDDIHMAADLMGRPNDYRLPNPNYPFSAAEQHFATLNREPPPIPSTTATLLAARGLLQQQELVPDLLSHVSPPPPMYAMNTQHPMLHSHTFLEGVAVPDISLLERYLIEETSSHTGAAHDGNRELRTPAASPMHANLMDQHAIQWLGHHEPMQQDFFHDSDTYPKYDQDNNLTPMTTMCMEDHDPANHDSNSTTVTAAMASQIQKIMQSTAACQTSPPNHNLLLPVDGDADVEASSRTTTDSQTFKVKVENEIFVQPRTPKDCVTPLVVSNNDQIILLRNENTNSYDVNYTGTNEYRSSGHTRSYSSCSSVPTTPSVSSHATTPSVSGPCTPANPVNRIDRPMPFNMDELYRIMEQKLNTGRDVQPMAPMSHHEQETPSTEMSRLTTEDAEAEMQLPKTPHPSPDASQTQSRLSSPRSSIGSNRARNHPYRVPRHKTPAHRDAEIRRQERIRVLVEKLREIIGCRESEVKFLNQVIRHVKELESSVASQEEELISLRTEMAALEFSQETLWRDLDDSTTDSPVSLPLVCPIEDENQKTIRPLQTLHGMVQSSAQIRCAQNETFKLFWQLCGEPLGSIVDADREHGDGQLEDMVSCWLEKLNKQALRISVQRGLKAIATQGYL